MTYAESPALQEIISNQIFAEAEMMTRSLPQKILNDQVGDTKICSDILQTVTL